MLSRRAFLQVLASACVAAGVDLPPLAAMEEGLPDAPIPVRDAAGVPLRGFRLKTLSWQRQFEPFVDDTGYIVPEPVGLPWLEARVECDPYANLTADEEWVLQTAALRGDDVLLDETMHGIRVQARWKVEAYEIVDGLPSLQLHSIGPITISRG